VNVTINGDVYISGRCSECTQVDITETLPGVAGDSVAVNGFAFVDSPIVLTSGATQLVLTQTGPVQWNVDIEQSGQVMTAQGCGRLWIGSIEVREVDQ